MLDREIRSLIEDQKLLHMAAGASVAEAAGRMADTRVGAMLVCDATDSVCGIFTERDALVRVVAAGLDPRSTALGDVMTPNPAAVKPDDTVLSVIFAMKQNRSRHLLVKSGENVVGVVSVRDLLRSLVDDALEERQILDDLWYGSPV